MALPEFGRTLARRRTKALVMISPTVIFNPGGALDFMRACGMPMAQFPARPGAVSGNAERRGHEPQESGLPCC